MLKPLQKDANFLFQCNSGLICKKPIII